MGHGNPVARGEIGLDAGIAAQEGTEETVVRAESGGPRLLPAIPCSPNAWRRDPVGPPARSTALPRYSIVVDPDADGRGDRLA